MAADNKIEPDEAEEPAEDAGEKAGTSKDEPKPASRFGGKLGMILGFGLVTVIAGGLGAGLGMQTASSVAAAIAERAKAQPPDERARSSVYSGDMMVEALEPVITNLASPTDVWVRLETSIVFANGAIENPAVTGAEIRQDIVAYARTLNIAQLEGPSALQHLREDLNERVAVRTAGKVNEIIIQSLIVQ